MVLIRELVQQALATGYLTVAAEEQLRQLLTTHYAQEDLDAFITLQLAAMSGQVKQEARELRQSHQLCYERKSSMHSTVLNAQMNTASGMPYALYPMPKTVSKYTFL